MKLSIVVPCYNEAENLEALCRRFGQVIHRTDIEIVFVDNGSNDNTATVLARLLPQYPFAKSIRIEVNQGYGYGIIQGLQECSGTFVGWTHADLQTDPADLMKALKIIEKYNDDEQIFVKGTRKGRPFFDRFFTVGMSIFESVYLGTRLYDINAQPNVCSRKFFNTWKNPPKDFSLDLYALYMAHIHKLHVRRFAVAFPERIHGASHWNSGVLSKWKFIKRTVAFSRNLKRKGFV